MRPTKGGKWEYVQERSVTPLSDRAVANTELEDLCEDMDEAELDELEPTGTGLTVSLVNGDATAIKNYLTTTRKKT